MAGLHLWQYYNTLLDSEEGPDGFKPLIDAAERYMLHVINSTPSSSSTSSQGGLPKQALEPDFMRTFFRNHADNIGLVLGLMECKLTTNSVRRSDATRNNAITYHVNKILLIALIASLQYRNETMRLYFGGEGNDGVDDSTTTRAFRPPVEPWTCSKKMLDLLTRQLENTRACLNTTGAGSKPLTAEHYQNDQQLEGELKVQMCQMTDMLLGAYTDRVMHLQEANSEGVEQLREQQRVLHTWVIKPLVDIGKMEDAYFIAEKYRIYQSLVDMTLVTKNTGGHIEDADAKASRLGLYLDRFGQEFADVLFSTLVKENKYRELLDEKIRISNNEYDSLLDSYLKRFNMPWLSWIQDVKMRRYSGASANLNLVCKNEDDIDKKLVKRGSVYPVWGFGW